MGTTHSDSLIRNVREIEEYAANDNPTIAVLAVPAYAAQAVADQLVRVGIKGIVNFASILIRTPRDVIVQNVDITTEPVLLGFRIQRRAR